MLTISSPNPRFHSGIDYSLQPVKYGILVANGSSNSFHRENAMKMRYRFTISLAAATISLAGCNSESIMQAPSDDAAVSAARVASAPAPDRAASKYEIDFMTDMIDHHAMAVQMAEMCVEKNLVHEDLRDLCSSIAASQTAEMQQIQSWLLDWYGITYEPQMKPGMMKEMEKLAALDGAEFEIAFMEMMIKHHKKAVKQGEQCQKKAYHSELIELCGNIVEAQSEEIELIESWLCEWYGLCKP
jgi:uncharacterized protein (DUF305 family)